MSDNFDNTFDSFWDTSDNICENIDWKSSGIQSQILADFAKSRTQVSAFPTPLAPVVQAAANRFLDFRAK